LTLRRKIREALVALRLDQILSKNRILELYLNEIYLGRGSYGVAAASLTYFNKPLDQLSIAQAAFLGALPKAPSGYNPAIHHKAALDRRNWVIDRMADDGFITRAQATAAKPVALVTVKHSHSDTVTAPYFAEEVRRTLVARYGEKALYEGGLTVRTSLDPKLQTMADQALRGGLIAYDRRHGYRGPVAYFRHTGKWQAQLKTVPVVAGADSMGWKLAYVLSLGRDDARIGFADGGKGVIPMAQMKWARRELDHDRGVGRVPRRPRDVMKPGDVVLAGATGKAGVYGLEQVPEVSGAIAVIDPHTGRVLALAGGFSYDRSQFDRATQAFRQMGSAIKPFVYIAAFEHGFTPSTRLLDEPVEISQGPGLPMWRPQNYAHELSGLMTLRVAVEKSQNLVTARLAQKVGLDAIAKSVQDFGIMKKMPHEYSMVLGAGLTTPLRLTAAYAMLDDGGRKLTPTVIDRVQNRDGITIYRADTRVCQGCEDVTYHGQPPPAPPDNRPQIVDPQSDYQIVSILEGVVKYGTGRIVSSLGRPMAGKTGTTNDSKDAWFVGFSPNLVAGVYVGFDTPRTLGRHETGASVAAPIFKEFMATALKNKPPVPFRTPPGILLVRVDHYTGELPYPGDKNVILEAFKPGTEPTGEATAGNSMSLQRIEDDEDAASLEQPGQNEYGNSSGYQQSAAAATPVSAGSGSGSGSEPVQVLQMPHNAPASGTGGLY
ncbi:MAG: penicillin-binding protein 1A, partial [Stellaceae bacterium]